MKIISGVSKRLMMAGTMALVACAVACGNGVTVDNENPRGTVGGLLVDAVTQKPLDGVAVTILSAGGDGTYNVTTGADGFYRIGNVPSGSFTLQLAKEGYVSAMTTADLQGAVGNFPITAPILTMDPMALIPAAPSFVVRVVDSNGAAVAGVKGTARVLASYLTMANGGVQASGAFAVSAETAADGRLVFAGLPNIALLGSVASAQVYVPALGYIDISTILVSVAPVNVMGQDNYQYVGGVFQFSSLTATSTVQQIILRGPSDALKVVETNLEWLRDGFVPPTAASPVLGSVVPTNGPITIAFSEAIDPTTLRAQLVTDAGGAGPALTPTVNLNLVSLAPATPLEGGKRYNLVLHVNAALNPSANSRQRDALVPFFAKIDPATKPTVVSAKITGNTIQFVLSEPIGLGDGVAQSYNCVVFYEGVNLDGSGAGVPLVSGEWSTDPGALTCSTVSPVTMPVINPVTQNAGLLSSQENKGSTTALPLSGYATNFVATFEAYTTGAVPAAAPNSNVPAQGTKGHLYFPRLNTTVHRVSGEPVGDLTFTVQ